MEADIKGFFDHLQWPWLMQMLEQRIQEGAFLGLIRKGLRAGILEADGQVIHPQTGTPQGGVVSPVLANVYLHDVRDLWFERQVRPGDQGRCQLFRFADDFVVGFERKDEAAAFEQALKEPMAKFELERAPDKTKRLRFGRGGGPDNDRFDFLGFEFRWEADRKGRPTVKRRTARKKLHAGIQRMKQWIKSHRHLPVKQWLKKLASKRRGTWNYYGIIGNSRSLAQLR